MDEIIIAVIKVESKSQLLSAAAIIHKKMMKSISKCKGLC
ncbi:hypothetical protein HMP0721_1165 [Pseudoramibacter alactolyticus ATCC 23263]|uniref:Uncharacterized protein n=1 Tax=Pseudoramibacter alactolyticus ATCC 23263 TaxID=887929 RepID=E6MGN2_9FIRM|nr:hypothetical protein HMP0721_1165 [Pseudoramibacter alactolyticus ATCC 23263]